MVCLVLPGLLFFKTARMQRQGKGLHAPLLRKGRLGRAKEVEGFKTLRSSIALNPKPFPFHSHRSRGACQNIL